MVIDTLGRELVKTVHFTLRLACRVGCLVLVKQLFRADAHDPELRQKMLSIQENSQYSSNNISHQKGSEAASSNHAGIVKFLYEQEGIEAYARHINTHNGYAVSHQTGENPDAGLYKILIPVWAEGLNLADKNGDYPVDGQAGYRPVPAFGR